MSVTTAARTGIRNRIVASLLANCFAGAQYLCVLLGLLAFGYSGHHSNWSFGITKATADERPDTVVSMYAHKIPLSSNGLEIQFPSDISRKRSGIQTTPIKQRHICERVKTTGVITCDERLSASLASRASGTCWRVIKHAGDPIRRGDVLVIIDAADVGRAKADFLSQLVAVESKSEFHQSLEGIAGAISGRQIRDARVALREARIQLQNAEQSLVNLGLNVRKETFEKMNDGDRAAKLQFLGLPDSVLKDVDAAQTTSNLLALTASFDGVLIRNDVATGEMVEVGKPVLEIADLRRMWLKLDVPKEDASKLSIGQKLSFSPDGIDEDLESTITWISTEMNEQTRTLQVRAEVENPVVSSNPETNHEVRMLRAHTFGTGVIVLREIPTVMVVPIESVMHIDDQPVIFVKANDLNYVRIDVKLGVREDNQIQIEASELRPGLEVVLQGSHVLKSEWLLNHVAAAGR